MNILIFGAHPDDIEVLCGGTAVKYSRLGHKVTYCIMTDGQVGSNDIPNKELIEVRKKEAKAAADMVKADLIHFSNKDELLFDNEENRLKVLEVILTVRPDVIITMSPNDYAIDHQTVYKIVLAAVPMTVVRNHYSSLPALDKHPVIYLMDNIFAVDFIPTEYVDISEDIEIKMNALKCHKSQMVQTEVFNSYGFADSVLIQSQFRGVQARVKYAEGFRKVENWYNGTTKRYLP